MPAAINSYFPTEHVTLPPIAEISPPPFFNSLTPRGPRCHFKTAIFNLVLLIGIFTSSKDNALRWMPRDLTDDKSTLVQVMARCRQARSHYLSQCWPSSTLPYGVTRPQWVKSSHLKIEHLLLSSIGAGSLTELEKLGYMAEYQGSSPQCLPGDSHHCEGFKCWFHPSLLAPGKNRIYENMLTNLWNAHNITPSRCKFQLW